MSAPVPPFVFGKLPAHGDFIARGLDDDARTVWDDWLAREFVAARAAHGAAFDTRYEAAPVWHFAIDLAEGKVAGGLALSVDAAGRRFPVLAGRGADCAAELVAARCEDCLYDAIAGRWTADELHAAIGAIEIDPDMADSAAEVGWWTAGNEAFAGDRIAGTWPDGLLARMLGPQEMDA